MHCPYCGTRLRAPDQDPCPQCGQRLFAVDAGAVDPAAVDPEPGHNGKRPPRPWHVLVVVLSVAAGLVVAVSALDLVAVAADAAAVIGEAVLEVGLPLLCAGLGLWIAVRALHSRWRPDR